MKTKIIKLRPTPIDMEKFNREAKEARKLPPEERLKAMGIYSIKDIEKAVKKATKEKDKEIKKLLKCISCGNDYDLKECPECLSKFINDYEFNSIKKAKREMINDIESKFSETHHWKGKTLSFYIDKNEWKKLKKEHNIR